jgi:hypothetical protein
MDDPVLLNAPSSPRSKPSRFLQALGWTPIVLMGLTIAVLVSMLAIGGMLKITAWYLLQVVPPLLGVVSLLGCIILAIVQRRLSKPLTWTGILALVSLLPAILMVVPVAYPASLEKTYPSATIRLPADAPMRVIWGGDSLARNQHAIVPDQRWAYDFLIEPYLSGSSNLEDYGCYGVPVVAPIAGTVSAANDTEPDMQPGKLSNNTQAPEGNRVVIRMASETYLVIAHLKSGSVLVKTGDMVEEGQQIGQCGNSGNTSEPHIHIHHQRQDPAAYPINFAEGLPLYFRDHNGQPMPQGGVRIEDNKAIPIGDLVQHLSN